jgi:hypothetical protein
MDNSATVREIRKRSIAAVFGNVFSDLQGRQAEEAAVETLRVARSLISYYHKYLSTGAVMRLISNEFAKDGTVRRSVGAIRFLREWVYIRFDADFRGNRNRMQRLYKFLLSVNYKKSDELRDELNAIKLFLISKYPWIIKPELSPGKRRGTSAVETPRLSMSLELSLSVGAGRISLMKLDSRFIASHMIRVTFDAFQLVSPPDFYDNNPLNHTGLRSFVKRNEDTRAWVSSMILIQPTPKTQRGVAIKFIEVANFCREAGNLQDCYAIVQAFLVHEVARVRRIWGVPENIRAMAGECEQLFSHEGNYKALRAEVRRRLESKKLCIPYLGVWQKDVTMSTEANPLYNTDNTVNMDKLKVEGDILANIAACQAKHPGKNHGPWTNEPLLNLLRELPHKSQKELEVLSETIRPRRTADGADSSATSKSAWGPASEEGSSTLSTRSDDNSGRSDDYVDL